MIPHFELYRRFRASWRFAAWTTLLCMGCQPEPAPADAPSATSPGQQARELETSAPARGKDGATDAPTPSKSRHRVETPAQPKVGDRVSVKEFYETGELYTERTEVALEGGQRRRVGAMRVWWENGSPRIEGEYDDQGRLTGHWRYYYELGGVEREGDFDTGKHEGIWVENWPSGQRRNEGLYHVGMREGFWRTWREDGKPESEGEYIGNRPQGEWSFWKPDGSLDAALSGEYENGERLE